MTLTYDLETWIFVTAYSLPRGSLFVKPKQDLAKRRERKL